MLSLIISSALVLQGTWIKPCEALAEQVWVHEKLKIQAETWTRESYVNDQENCDGRDFLTLRQVWKVTHDGQKVDMSLKTASYRPTTEQAALSLNDKAYCGYTDWRVGHAKEVTEHICGEFNFPPQGHLTYSFFHLLRLRPSTLLWLGESSNHFNGQTPATRHATFESFAFEKENSKAITGPDLGL